MKLPAILPYLHPIHHHQSQVPNRPQNLSLVALSKESVRISLDLTTHIGTESDMSPKDSMTSQDVDTRESIVIRLNLRHQWPRCRAAYR